MYDLFPTAMTELNARKVFLHWYNSALHFVTWERTSTYVRFTFRLPPKCLERQMKSDVDYFVRKRKEIVDANPDEYKEWAELDMNFSGLMLEE